MKSRVMISASLMLLLLGGWSSTGQQTKVVSGVEYPVEGMFILPGAPGAGQHRECEWRLPMADGGHLYGMCKSKEVGNGCTR